MKKLFCGLLAVIMVLSVFPFAVMATAGVQSTVTADPQITTNVCTIWYMKDGVETKYADYATLDAASDGLRDLYVGPLADETLVDGEDEDTNLNNELYAAAGSPVIKLNGNFQGDYVRPNWATDPAVSQYITYDMNKVPTVVIDGAKSATENWTVTYGTSATAFNTNTFNHLAFYNLTVKNTNMVINSGANTVDGTFCWAGNAYRDNDDNAYTVVPGESFTIFENCVIKQNSTVTSGSGCLFKMNGYKKFDSTVTADPCLTDKYNLILKDTHVEAAVGIGHQAHWGSDVNIEFYNSSMGLVDKGGDNGNNNDALLKFYEAGVGRVYLDSDSMLFSRREDSGATVALIRVLSNQKANVTVELEEGAELAMMNTVALTEKTYIADGGKGMTTVIDNGAIYSASAIDAKTGVNVPLALKDATWIKGNGAEATVAHPVTVTVDSDTGDETETVDTTKVRYTDPDGTNGVILTTSTNAPITVKKNGEAVTDVIPDVNAAFDYVYGKEDSEAYTIYLNTDVSVGDYMNPANYKSTAVKTVTIDGQNNDLWAFNPTATFYGIGLYNLILSDLTMIYAGDQSASLDWSPRLTPSDSYGNYIATGSNPVVDTHSVFTNVVGRPAHEFITAGNFKLKGGNAGTQNKGAYGIRLVDSEFTSTLADTMFMMNDAGNLDLDVIGTTLNYLGGANYTHLGNNSIIICNGAAVDVNVENSANNVSVLNANTRSTPATCGIIANHTTYSVNVTLGKDVEVRLSGNDSKTGAWFFAEEKSTTTITDNGAKWIVGKELLDNGAAVTLPSSMFANSEEDHVWYVDGDAVTNPYADATATADVTLTHGIPVDPAEGNVAYIELDGTKTYYATLSSAINALGDIYAAVTTENLTDEALWQAAGSPVITLYDDITITAETYPSWISASTYDANRVRTVVIKGEKADGTTPLITSTVAGAAFSYNAYYNLTLENIDLNCTQGFALFWRGYNIGNKSAKSTTNMIDCNITATGTGGEGLVFKVTGNQNQTKTENYIINMVNTNVTAKAGVNAVFLFHHGCAGELNIDGASSITHTQNRNSDGGDTMFMLGTNRKFDINVASGAELTANVEVCKPGGAYAYTYAIFRIENSNNYASADGVKNVINIADDAVITLNASDSCNATKIMVIDNNLNPASAATNVDLGTYTLKTNAKARTLPIGVFDGHAVDDGTVIGIKLNGTNALYNNNLPANALTADSVTVEHVFYNVADVAMVAGASLRTVSGENGLRFTTSVSEALTATLAANGVSTTAGTLKFGTIIASNEQLGTSALTHSFTTNLLDIASTNNFQAEFTDGNGNTYANVYHAAVIMPNTADDLTDEAVIAANQKVYNLELAARGYMTITYADGSTATFYTAFDADDNVRSMKDVADNLKGTEYETNDVVKHIIDTCDYVIASGEEA